MNKQFLKTIRDTMPEFVKQMAAPLMRKRLVRDKDFVEYFTLLKNRETLVKEKIRNYQLAQLKAILNHAYRNVPYYEKLFRQISFDPAKFSSFEQMQNIPFLTKELVRENYKDLISREESARGSYMATTGGSTGEPLKLQVDYASIFKENAFIYYYRSKAGYKFEDKLATFRGVEFGDRFWKLNPFYNEILLSPFKISRKTIKDYVDKLNEYKPVFLNGYLSSIYFFAKLLEENNLKPNIELKGIFLISENVDGNQRKFIENFFKARAFTFYGHTERCIIAQETSPGVYEFDPYYGYTECIPFEKNTFSIVGTGFLNYIMPFIRYRTDDICIDCGGHYTIRGRRESTAGLSGKNDEYFGQSAFNFHSDIFRNVSNYQFVQKEKGKADFLIIVNKDFKPSEIEMMKKEIARKTEGIIEFNIEVVDSLILTSSGKFNMFVKV